MTRNNTNDPTTLRDLRSLTALQRTTLTAIDNGHANAYELSEALGISQNAARARAAVLTRKGLVDTGWASNGEDRDYHSYGISTLGVNLMEREEDAADAEHETIERMNEEADCTGDPSEPVAVPATHCTVPEDRIVVETIEHTALANGHEWSFNDTDGNLVTYRHRLYRNRLAPEVEVLLNGQCYHDMRCNDLTTDLAREFGRMVNTLAGLLVANEHEDYADRKAQTRTTANRTFRK